MTASSADTKVKPETSSTLPPSHAVSSPAVSVVPLSRVPSTVLSPESQDPDSSEYPVIHYDTADAGARLVPADHAFHGYLSVLLTESASFSLDPDFPTMRHENAKHRFRIDPKGFFGMRDGNWTRVVSWDPDLYSLYFPDSRPRYLNSN